MNQNSDVFHVEDNLYFETIHSLLLLRNDTKRKNILPLTQ